MVDARTLAGTARATPGGGRRPTTQQLAYSRGAQERPEAEVPRSSCSRPPQIGRVRSVVSRRRLPCWWALTSCIATPGFTVFDRLPPCPPGAFEVQVVHVLAGELGEGDAQPWRVGQRRRVVAAAHRCRSGRSGVRGRRPPGPVGPATYRARPSPASHHLRRCPRGQSG